ncbi:glutathione S-transferase [Aurantiacibacter rhizosphaerae]|uniref:Glutathione S-transferase n=1 Tax=Aurantiacibacter rhizosphaerae TaxID=2691582 RepID=A0A844XD33_9SPHN|nr:glutathione S-transferase [Aurantiacibacter rhizosphaerae]MWV28451.1 glutathione S-transferase [Aurantiacibacter rhizosphaerae]
MSDGAHILYSFRRCPYAMRARMALTISRTQCELREVKLSDKPQAMLDASPKGTVPVLMLDDGTVIDESFAIMRWALARNDPEGWLERDDPALIADTVGQFKHALDHYKYPNRYDDCDPLPHRADGLVFLQKLDERIGTQGQLCGEKRGIADTAIFPFIRQFANHDREWFDSQDLPHLQAWLAGHLASPLFKTIMQREKPWTAGDPPIAMAL